MVSRVGNYSKKTIEGYKQAVALKENEGERIFKIKADLPPGIVFEGILDCVRQTFKFRYENAQV